MAAHLAGTDGAHVVETAHHRELRVVADRIIALGETLAVDGPSGSGKTFAVDQYLHEHCTLPLVKVQVSNRPVGREITWRLHTELTGSRTYQARTPRYVYDDEICELLERTPHVVWIDEAQYLGYEGLNYLRFLHDVGGGAWPLLLVGSGVLRTLGDSPELENRTAGIVKFTTIPSGELPETLGCYHRLFAGADHELLHQIDREVAHGVWRTWGHVLQYAIPAAAAAGVEVMNRPVANAAVRALRGEGLTPPKKVR